MPHPKVKLSDDSGNAVSVTSNRLDVNAYLSATPTIDIGDVSLLLGGTAASVNAGTMDAQTLRITIATDDTHFGAVGVAADADGVLHGQLYFANNALASIEGDTSTMNTNIGYLAGAIDTTVLAFSLTGASIPAGCGDLVLVELDGEPTGLSDIVVSDIPEIVAG